MRMRVDRGVRGWECVVGGWCVVCVIGLWMWNVAVIVVVVVVVV